MLERPARLSDAAKAAPAKVSPAMPARALALLGLCLCLAALGGCGRRGALEPPNAGASERGAASGTAAAAPASPRSLPTSVGLGSGTAAADPDAVRDGDEVPTTATPPGLEGSPVKTARGAKRGYTIPRQPFILDPIL